MYDTNDLHSMRNDPVEYEIFAMRKGSDFRADFRPLLANLRSLEEQLARIVDRVQKPVSRIRIVF